MAYVTVIDWTPIIEDEVYGNSGMFNEGGRTAVQVYKQYIKTIKYISIKAWVYCEYCGSFEFYYLSVKAVRLLWLLEIEPAKEYGVCCKCGTRHPYYLLFPPKDLYPDDPRIVQSNPRRFTQQDIPKTEQKYHGMYRVYVPWHIEVKHVVEEWYDPQKEKMNEDYAGWI